MNIATYLTQITSYMFKKLCLLQASHSYQTTYHLSWTYIMCWNGVRAATLITNGAASGRHLKSNFMGGTMNFLFQDSPVRQMKKRCFTLQFSGSKILTWPWKIPSDIRDCLCAIWTISLVCRAALCVPVAWLVVSVSHSLEPAPVAALAKLRGVGLPETLSRSALGPSQFTHTTLYYWANLPNYSHCPAKKVYCFF